MPTALTTIVHTAPAAVTTVLQTVKTDAVMAREAIASEIEILPKCKHVDRKRNREPCQGALRIRNHKRGYLAIVCERGHQWVWCSCCCDCARCGIGCGAMQHWMERDSFDTGRRNHMQRHMADYDANDDLDGALMAELQPRQVAMPKHGSCRPPRMAEPRASYAASINEALLEARSAAAAAAAAALPASADAAVGGVADLGRAMPEDAAAGRLAGGDGAPGAGATADLGPAGADAPCPPGAAPSAFALTADAPPDRAARRPAAPGPSMAAPGPAVHWRQREPAPKRSPPRPPELAAAPGRPPREPRGAELAASGGCGPCGPTETARDGAPGGRGLWGGGPRASGAGGEAGLEEAAEELGSIGVAAVALIALRRSVRINGADD
jgi:hypothetical protein